MDKMKVAIIGCGTIANSAHIPSYMKNEDVEIKYFCDIIPERAEAAVEKYGCGKAGVDYKEVLADPEVEAVSVCTPNLMHSVISIDALKAGKNVLCEKPAARIYEEAVAMQQAQHESGKVLNIGVVNRFNNQVNRIREYIHEGDIESAHNLCRKTDTPYSRLIDKGLSRIGRPMNDVLVAIENTGNIEVANLGKGFPWLSTTAAGAPMLGFLGTVTGMIQAFFSLANAGTSADITVLSSGIYQALVTTVAGLVVGIIALFAYNYLVARVNRVMNSLEMKTMEFMDLLNEPA